MRWKGSLLLLGGLVFGLLMGFLIVQGGAFIPGAEQARKAPEVGQVAPDFSLMNLEGETVQLSQYRGKVVFLNFWATWCDACRDEMPELEQFARENSSAAVVLGVNLKESSEQVAGFVEQEGITFPILLDGDGEVAGLYTIRAYPTTLVIDPDGKIQAIQIGPLTREELSQYMRQAESND